MMKNQLLIALRQPLGGNESVCLEAACSFEIDLQQLQAGDQSSFLQQLQQSLNACEQALRQAQESVCTGSLLSSPSAESEHYQLISKGNAATNGGVGNTRISASSAPTSTTTSKSTGTSSPPAATVKQLRAIQAIARKMGLQPIEFAKQFFSINRLDQLTLSQASRVIDELKSQQAPVA
jgi:hypothetical protein